MLRLIVWLLLAAGPAFAADFVRAPGVAFSGADTAAGALVWIHGTYGRDQAGPPEPPDFVSRMTADGMDLWCLNRDRNADPIPGSAEALAAGIRQLRDQGYRRIVVAGHSRGAWIGLTVLAHPGLADAVVAFSPAAHGPREERRAQAIRDWSELWALAGPEARVVLVQLSGDAWDPDPAQRLTIARARMGEHLLSIFWPMAPVGHGGVYEPEFDQRFGAEIAAFVRQN